MAKLCFSTLGCTERSLASVISLANRYGISALEVRGLGGELRNDKISDFLPENATETKQALLAAGIIPLVLGTSVSFHDEKSFDANIAAGKADMDIARRIGFSAIRVFGNSIVGDEQECMYRVARGIRELCLAAKGSGVGVWLEVHGEFNTLSRVLGVAELCSDLSEFGIIWDICHTHAHYAENWRAFYEPLAPYIRHVHLKDVQSSRHVLLGQGELPITDIVNHLLANGYGGYFSLEWERHWRRELPPVEDALDSLFTLFSTAENK